MPTHDYRCPVCGDTLEITLPFGTTGALYCHCGVVANRLVGKPTVIYKGDGWYREKPKREG